MWPIGIEGVELATRLDWNYLRYSISESISAQNNQELS